MGLWIPYLAVFSIRPMALWDVYKENAKVLCVDLYGNTLQIKVTPHIIYTRLKHHAWIQWGLTFTCYRNTFFSLWL